MSQSNHKVMHGVGTQAADKSTQAKRAYSSPRLVIYGDIRSETLGPSVWFGDSGDSGSEGNRPS